MIQTILFDLGNVIVFFSQKKMIQQLSECSGLPIETIQKLMIYRDQYEAGLIPTEKLYQLFANLSPKKFSQRDFLHAASDIFTPNEAIFPLIQTLKDKNFRLILLSNTSSAHFEYLQPKLPILNLFDQKILSYEIKACKPESKIFQEAMKAAQCSPQECFYTDDIEEYILAAKKHKIDAEIFIDVPTLKTHLSKRCLI